MQNTLVYYTYKTTFLPKYLFYLFNSIKRTTHLNYLYKKCTQLFLPLKRFINSEQKYKLN